MADATSRDLTSELILFVGLLRAAGIRIGTGQVEVFVQGAATLAPVDHRDIYWAGRVTLVVGHADLPVYDRVFASYWLDTETVSVEGEGVATDEHEAAAVMVSGDADEDGTRERGRADAVGAVASDAEQRRRRRFDEMSEEELVAMRNLMVRIPVDLPRRRSRRTASTARGSRPDLRRTFRKALRTDGEIIEHVRRERRERPRRLVLVLDVSGSMAGYSRALLQFAHAVRVAIDELEVFCFGTRLTRITHELDHREPDRALEAAAARVVDWDGGTRIGASFATLNRRWGKRGLLRGAIVVVCSDGLDRGDPAQLGREVARLRRSAHRVVWVNPLKGGRDYEPIQAGMRASLPHVDRFLAGHDLASLEELGDVLRQLR